VLLRLRIMTRTGSPSAAARWTCASAASARCARIAWLWTLPTPERVR